MALERSLKMITTDSSDETYTITFSHANPNVSYSVLNTAMRQLNALSKDTYEDTHVIDTQSLNSLVLAGGA